MDQSTKDTHLTRQIALLMNHTNSMDEAIKAYFKHGENTDLAANALHYDRFMN